MTALQRSNRCLVVKLLREDGVQTLAELHACNAELGANCAVFQIDIWNRALRDLDNFIDFSPHEADVAIVIFDWLDDVRRILLIHDWHDVIASAAGFLVVEVD